ncbi:MAG: methyltransferase domain-containing protein [Bacteroidales bacterium]|nr:methyltransferase domain-containing protein [Bacteroidales bacterium]
MFKSIYRKCFNERSRLWIRRELTRANRFFIGGNSLQCNVCGKSYGKFLSHGHIKRSNARCPNCLSLERTRVLWYYLVEEEKIKERKLSVLHFAPEQGVESKIKALPNIKYYTADLNPNLADHKVDITNIPFKENHFDLIICSHVLVEVPDEELALKELFRTLKVGGKVIIITAIINKEKTQKISGGFKEKMEKYGANIHRMRGEDFSSYIKNAGFEVKEFEYQMLYSSKRIKNNALGDGQTERVFICSK